jgi:long-subunit acyl-CoA synthetase (AMP-forming)
MTDTMTQDVTEPVRPHFTTLCEAFRHNVEHVPGQVALRTAGDEREITWAQYDAHVRAFTAGLAALGVGRGETVALMLTNSPDAWLVDTSVMHAGATPFSIYNTSAPEQIEYLLGHAGARVAVTEMQFVDRILAAKPSIPSLRHVFVVDGHVPGAEPLSHLAELGHADFDFESCWRSVEADDVAVLIYTSGTTGAPKAVELTHANLVIEWSSWLERYPQLRRGGRYVSYLPMAHLADRMVAGYPSFFSGASVTCYPDPRQAVASLPELRPTYFPSVPRMWEKMKAALEQALAQEPDEGKRAGVARAIQAGIEKVRLEMSNTPVPEELATTCRRAEETLFAGLRERLGLGEVDLLVSGAAPIAAEVLEFFAAIGLPIVEVWGMSEITGVVTSNPQDAIRIGTVGKPLPGLELRVAEDGELLVRGATVMRGYRNDPERTAEAIDREGWVHTGDIGVIDDDGYVTIVDRKKELIISSAGKNMSPANIENRIKAGSSLIGNVVAIGDRRAYNTALIALDPEGAEAFALAHGLADSSVAALAADDRVRAHLEEAVAKGNAQLSRVEQVKKFVILPDEWEPDSDVLTATMKLKRKAIDEKYAATIDSLYADVNIAPGGGFYEPGIYVDSFDADADGNIRARREDVYCPVEVGQVVSVDCDDLGTFARIVRFEGHPEAGFVFLKELSGKEWEQASEDLALSYEDWCDPLDD